jgi:hypothetical protein
MASSTSTLSPARMPAAVLMAFLTGRTYELLLLSGKIDVDQRRPAMEALTCTEPKALRKGTESSLSCSARSCGSVMKCHPACSGWCHSSPRNEYDVVTLRVWHAPDGLCPGSEQTRSRAFTPKPATGSHARSRRWQHGFHPPKPLVGMFSRGKSGCDGLHKKPFRRNSGARADWAVGSPRHSGDFGGWAALIDPVCAGSKGRVK